MQVTPRDAAREVQRKQQTELKHDASAEIARRRAENRHLQRRLGHSASQTTCSGNDVRSDGTLLLTYSKA